eukprot:6184104-Pleurochrysis_carterae.AAC.1
MAATLRHHEADAMVETAVDDLEITTRDDSRAARNGPANPFTAELGLLSTLKTERKSAHKDRANSFPAPKPLQASPSKRYRSVPPLSEHEISTGEVQSLAPYGKLALAESSTGHANMKEMQIARKARHEAQLEAYQLRRAGMDVELEARTRRAGRNFKQLLALNDAELQTMNEEYANPPPDPIPRFPSRVNMLETPLFHRCQNQFYHRRCSIINLPASWHRLFETALWNPHVLCEYSTRHVVGTVPIVPIVAFGL